MTRSRLHKSTAIIALAGLHAAWLLGGFSAANAAVDLHVGGPDASKLSMPQSSAARNAFVAALGWHGVDSLETLGGQQNPTLTFGATGVTAQTGFPSGVFAQYPYSVSGVHFALDTEGIDDWLQFSQPVTAFGAYIVQAGDGASAPPTSTPANTLTLRLENTSLGTTKDVVVGPLGPDWSFYNVIFVGVTDTEPFDRVSFHETYDRDGLLWDDLIIGNFVTGDFNGNGVIDGSDLGVWRIHLGAMGYPEYVGGDGDGDGDVDGSDLLIWQRQIAAPFPGSTVPESASIVIVLTAAVLVGGAVRAKK
jgi:hypothetical protein